MSGQHSHLGRLVHLARLMEAARASLPRPYVMLAKPEHKRATQNMQHMGAPLVLVNTGIDSAAWQELQSIPAHAAKADLAGHVMAHKMYAEWSLDHIASPFKALEALTTIALYEHDQYRVVTRAVHQRGLDRVDQGLRRYLISSYANGNIRDISYVDNLLEWVAKRTLAYLVERQGGTIDGVVALLGTDVTWHPFLDTAYKSMLATPGYHSKHFSHLLPN